MGLILGKLPGNIFVQEAETVGIIVMIVKFFKEGIKGTIKNF